MKKVLSIIVILLLFSLTYTVNASETQVEPNNTTANIKFETITSEDSITVQISTGEFEGVEENSVMSASMTLVYDEANIIQVEGQEFNDWRITIANETKRVLIETDNATSNTEIAQITFYFNQDVTETITGSVFIQEINVSDGNLYDETYPEFTQSYTINPPQEDPEENNQPTQNEQETLPEINTNTNGISQEEYKSPNQSGNTSDQDNTVAPNSIPQTGISMGIVIGIVAIVIIAVVCFIKYRSIEIK